MKWDPRSTTKYLLPPHVVVVAASLECFHPQRSNCLVDKTKLTQREGSHFITATITAKKTDLKKKKRRDQRKRLRVPRPSRATPFIAQTVCCEWLRALQSAING
jgi:hypothetical protein